MSNQRTSNSLRAALRNCCAGFLFAATFPLAQAQLYRDLGVAQRVTAEPSGVLIQGQQGQMRVSVYSPSLIRFRTVRESFGRDSSYAVVLKPVNAGFQLKQTAEQVEITTDSMVVRIGLKPIRVTCYDKQGRMLNRDEPAFGAGFNGEQGTVHKELLKDERFIGLGEKTGPLDRRGNGYTNWNTDFFGYPSGADPIYASIPFYIGIHPQGFYGILLDNTYRSDFNFGASNERFSSFTTHGGELDYYFVYGSSVPSILDAYTRLTGRPHLPPLWSLGYQQCRYSYYPEAEVLRVAKTFREKKVPADVIYLDIHYMDAYKIFTWHPERFPKPKRMLDELKSLGFRTTVIVDPGIKVEPGYEAYEDGLKKDVFLTYPDNKPFIASVWPGRCHFPDFTTKAGRDWWAGKFDGYVNDGIEGFWNDMNEPAAWGGGRIPDLVRFGFDGDTSSHRRGHNVYGLLMSRATAEGTQKLMNGKRPFILTRAAYAGIQRYSSIWTGDNQSNSDHMLAGVRLVNSLGLSGVPFAGMDVGGFTGGASATTELFGRWITIGAFTPFFRVHTAVNTRESDPFSYGERVEEISRNYISFRYRLLPYLYSTFDESRRTGMPVSRSLAINWPMDKMVYRYDNQFMFGPAFLVAPLEGEKDVCNLYLPQGTWHNLHTGKVLQGGQNFYQSASLEELPLFVKGGSIVPMIKQVQHTGEDFGDTLDVHVFPGADGRFTYYEDDGTTYGFEQGQFHRREMRFTGGNRLSLTAAQGSRASRFKYLRVVLHGDRPAAASKPRNGTATLTWTDAPWQPFAPMSRFDPVGVNAPTMQTPRRPALVVPYTAQAVDISW